MPDLTDAHASDPIFTLDTDKCVTLRDAFGV
jgi:cobaltochelatase CobS